MPCSGVSSILLVKDSIRFMSENVIRKFGLTSNSCRIANLTPFGLSCQTMRRPIRRPSSMNFFHGIITACVSYFSRHTVRISISSNGSGDWCDTTWRETDFINISTILQKRLLTGWHGFHFHNFVRWWALMTRNICFFKKFICNYLKNMPSLSDGTILCSLMTIWDPLPAAIHADRDFKKC